MNSIAEKARVAKIQFGSRSFEGLMFPDGSYGIGVSQIAELFQFDTNQASRTLKPLLGGDFQFDKTISELNPKAVNYIKLPDFERVILELSFKGNELAKEFATDLIGLSLHQLYCDAFGIKFEEEERQQWIKFREVHRKNYHPKLTIWFKADGCEGTAYGVRMNQFKAHLGLPLVFVGEYSEEELDKLNEAETEYHVLRRAGLNHDDAIKLIG